MIGPRCLKRILEMVILAISLDAPAIQSCNLLSSRKMFPGIVRRNPKRMRQGVCHADADVWQTCGTRVAEAAERGRGGTT